jgi:phage shock protein PspC (stress-responsive transcriptional regulator)
MKKTLSIHFGRQLFTIEEEAYDRLQAYIKKLEASLANESGVNDILEDIEMRFAELLQSYLGEHRKVVTLPDIEKGIASLGEAEEISEDSMHAENERTTCHTQSFSEKRLYRDSENNTIAGICSGLAAYLNLDPVILRIIFVVFGFMGFGIGLYLLLWIVIPSAKTPTERLQMRGKPITIDSLKEEIEGAAHRIRKDSVSAAKKFKANNQHISQRTKQIWQLVGKLIGIALIIGALFWLIAIGLVTSGLIDFIPVTGDQEYANFSEFLQLLTPVDRSYSLIWYAILLIGISGPLIAIIIGTRLILRKSNRFFTFNLIVFPVLFGVGIICGIIGGVQTARDHAVYSEVEIQHITGNWDTLNIEKLPVMWKKHKIVNTGGFDFLTIENKKIVTHGIQLKYRKSNDSLFHVYQRVSAHGVDRAAATIRAEHIEHVLRVDGHTIWIDPYFRFRTSDGLRNQQVEVIIEVPNNKKLYINSILENFDHHEYNGTFYSNEAFVPWEVD